MLDKHSTSNTHTYLTHLSVFYFVLQKNLVDNEGSAERVSRAAVSQTCYLTKCC